MGFIQTDGKPYWVSSSASRVDVSESYTLDFMEGLQCRIKGRTLFIMLISEKTLGCLDILTSSHLDTEMQKYLIKEINF